MWPTLQSKVLLCLCVGIRYAGKLLQAVGALDKAKNLDAEHPEVHVRIVDLKFRGSSHLLPSSLTFTYIQKTTFLSYFIAASKLPEDKAPSEPVKSLFEEALSKLSPPNEVSLETFNSQFLQKRSSEPEAVIAAAKVLKNLEAPVVEVENVLFGLVALESLSIKVRSSFSPPKIPLSLALFLLSLFPAVEMHC